MGMKPSLQTQCLLENTWRAMTLCTFVAHARKYKEHMAAVAAEHAATMAASCKARLPPLAPLTPITPHIFTPWVKTEGHFHSPPLTKAKTTILNDCQGCQKCCQVWAGHQANTCPNRFPTGPILIVNTPEPHINHTLSIPLASTFVNLVRHTSHSTAQHNIILDDQGQCWRKMSIDEDSESKSDSLGTANNNDNKVVADKFVRSLFVNFCTISPNQSSIPICALIDSGCSASVVTQQVVDALGLTKHKLKQPEPVTVAMGDGQKFTYTEYVVLSIQHPSLHWTSGKHIFCVAPIVGAEMYLGTPFLYHYSLVKGFNPPSLIIQSTGFDFVTGTRPYPPCQLLANPLHHAYHPPNLSLASQGTSPLLQSVLRCSKVRPCQPRTFHFSPEQTRRGFETGLAGRSGHSLLRKLRHMQPETQRTLYWWLHTQKP